MKYREALNAIDTIKGLNVIGLEPVCQGAYVKFPCPDCPQQASMKIYGEKKNLWYCPACKKSGHIISLAMRKKNVDYSEAQKLLLQTAQTKRIETELKLTYELGYHKLIAKFGISEEFAAKAKIGIPKGKTMLAGCITFEVADENGTKIAYYGVKIRTGKAVFHNSFNPELYLYLAGACQPGDTVSFVHSPMECAKFWSLGNKAVSNFSLPYITPKQIEILNRFDRVEFHTKNLDFPSMVAGKLQSWYRFL